MSDDVVEGVTLNIIESWDEAQLFMAWLGERRPVLACDTETRGLDWWEDHFLRLVQFGDLGTGWVIPWERWGGVAIEALARYSGPLAFHNAKFDIKALEVSGVKVKRGNLQDTRTMAHLLAPDNPTGLKQLGVRYVDAKADAGQTALKNGMLQNRWTWATVPVDFPPYWIYSALDPVLTAHLYQQFRPQIVGDLNDVYELEIAVLQVLNDIEKRGARCDIDYCFARQAEIKTREDEIRQWIRDEYELGAGQNKRIATALQADGVVLRKKTPSGGWCMDSDVLENIDHPLAQAVLNVRKCHQTADTYFGSYIEGATAGDDYGIIHPDINPLGARTGRMSVSRPPLQQIPRTKLMRSAFIPREGNRLVSVDFDQMEARLLTHFSADPGLIEAFGGGDFFMNMGQRIYGHPIEKGPQRTVVKNAIYATIYGAGAKKFAGMAGISEAEAMKFRQTLDDQFPRIRAFVRAVENEALANGDKTGVPYVTTPLGRRQPAALERGEYKLYALVNYLIQGTAADIFKRTVVQMDQAGLADYLVLPVHDEAVLDVPIDMAEDVQHETEAIFQSDDSWKVPLTAGGDILDCWGDKYE